MAMVDSANATVDIMLAAFVTACAAGDWEKAEALRLPVIAAFEASLDNIASGHRVIIDMSKMIDG